MSFEFNFGNDAAGDTTNARLEMVDLGTSSGIDVLFQEEAIPTIQQDRRVQASLQGNTQIRIAALSDLDGFAKVGSTGPGQDHMLVHKAERDLWKLSQDDKGFFVERLFNETGEPLKV